MTRKMGVLFWYATSNNQEEEGDEEAGGVVTLDALASGNPKCL